MNANQLMYTETTTQVQVVRVKKTLSAPTHWSCFTGATNRSLTLKAETVMEKVTKDNAGAPQVLGALVTFVRGWNRMCQNPKHRSAGVGDTAVRECVYEFVDQVCTAKRMEFDYRTVIGQADEKVWKAPVAGGSKS